MAINQTVGKNKELNILIAQICIDEVRGPSFFR
jgi:hypothetical protein